MTDFFENLLNNGELQEKVAELQGKIDAYQMSENEANEIITELKALIAQRDESITAQAEIILELKAENEIILERLTQYEEDADVQVCLFSDVKRLEQENTELKAENVEIKTSYINFIAKLKREMITKKDIQDLKHTVKKFVEERNSLRFENERLKEELAIYGATGVCEVCSDKANKLADKYLGCLQEIKEIAKTGMHCEGMGCDFMPKILDLITKAEEE